MADELESHVRERSADGRSPSEEEEQGDSRDGMRDHHGEVDETLHQAPSPEGPPREQVRQWYAQQSRQQRCHARREHRQDNRRPQLGVL
jgi:hypothetical protein